jgi:hypothetical protein
MLVIHKYDGTDEKVQHAGRKICMECRIDYGPAGTEHDSHGLCAVCARIAQDALNARPRCGKNGCVLVAGHPETNPCRTRVS